MKGKTSLIFPLMLAVLLVLGLLPLGHAQVPDLSDFALGLPGTIYVPNDSLNQTPTRITVWAQVHNEGEKDWIVYLLSNHNGTWTTERALGVVQPGQSENLTMDFVATYDGTVREKYEYAIVATGNAVPLGQYFSVVEDWSTYQNNANLKLHDAALVLVPTSAGLVVIMLALLAEWGYASKSPGAYAGEYTTRSLFLPGLLGRPLGEEIADMLIHPIFWVLEALTVVGIGVLIADGSSARPDWIAIMLLTALGSLVVPLVYFALVWLYNQKMEHMPLRFLWGAFMWGAAAAVMALAANAFYGPWLQGALGLDTATMALVVTALAAPLAEEFIKGMGLVLLLGHHEYSDALHGLLLGFAIGLGFSFVENWFYLAAKTDPLTIGLPAWVGLAAYRVFFNSVGHACFTAAFGASLGWAKSQGWGRLAYLAFIPGLAVAFTLHALFNITAILDGFSAMQADFPVFVFNPTLVMVLLILTGITLVQAVTDHRKRVKAEQEKNLSKFSGPMTE